MVFSTAKILLIILAAINLICIAIFTIWEKNKIAVALAVFEAFLVASASYFD